MPREAERGDGEGQQSRTSEGGFHEGAATARVEGTRARGERLRVGGNTGSFFRCAYELAAGTGRGWPCRFVGATTATEECADRSSPPPGRSAAAGLTRQHHSAPSREPIAPFEICVVACFCAPLPFSPEQSTSFHVKLSARCRRWRLHYCLLYLAMEAQFGAAPCAIALLGQESS